MKFLPVISALALSALAGAHPMGNFSINHYSKLTLRSSGADLTYILDIAEIPTFQLLSEWKTDAKDNVALNAAVRSHAKDWMGNLALASDGDALTLRLRSVEAATTDGAGSMPVLRITIHAFAPATAGVLTYEDRNYPGRAGWKEIVVIHDGGAEIRSSSQGAKDISAGLTQYPSDPSITPLQDLTARIEWAPAAAAVSAAASVSAQPAPPSPAPVAAVNTPAAVPPPGSFDAQQPGAAGTVVRGDYLSRMLGRKDLGPQLILFGLLAAFGIGALHALSPGHGKTIVAAYLVGSRGTMKHAGLLGLVVTFTHTFTVFMLGIGVLFFQKYFVPEKAVPVLGALSGLSIVVVGVSLLRSRVIALARARKRRNTPDYEHAHALPADGKITPASLIALGVSGGLVPCPSALILMLSAVALGRPALGLLLLVSFSSGLAIVLMAVGFAALYAKRLMPASKTAATSPVMRFLPVFSAVVVICIGLAITAASSGWIQPLKFLS